MADLYNWQLGRAMSYPYPEAPGRQSIPSRSSPRMLRTGPRCVARRHVAIVSVPRQVFRPAPPYQRPR